jgi:hypothetical protein
VKQKYIAGDLVKYIGIASPIVVQITEVREEKLLIDLGECNWYLADRSEVDSIRLTGEILEKNGFKEEQHQKEGTSEWYDFYHYDLGINIVYEVEENKFAAYLDGKKLREIQYAHELQHILWALGLNAELKV